MTSKHGSGFRRTSKQWESSISDHIGKFIDRLTFDDIISLMVGAIGGYTTNSWQGGVAGLVGYKLATTEGGTPPVAQIAGLVTLSSLGLASLLMQYDFIGMPTPVLGGPVNIEGQIIGQAGLGHMVKPTGDKGAYLCPDGYRLVYLPHGAIMCQVY